MSRPPALGFLLVGLAIAGGIVIAARGSARRSARIVYALLVSIWGLIAGLLGTVALGLWLFTDHVATYGNENIFLYNPLLLLAGVLLPLAALRGGRGARRAVRLAALVAGFSVIGTIVHFLPLTQQDNLELLLLGLPVNLALLIGARAIEGRFADSRRNSARAGEPVAVRQAA